MKSKTAIYRGQFGELKARDYLIKKNYTILETNYKTKAGEIDIIAEAPDKSVRFIEVKTYLHNNWVNPLFVIQKQLPKIKKAIQIYLLKTNTDSIPIQIDAIIVSEKHIQHLENV